MIFVAIVAMSAVIWACVAWLLAIMIGRSIRVAEQRRPRHRRTSR